MPPTISKAVIPAAGIGSRLLPLTKATSGIINYGLLKQLRRRNGLGGSVLINAGRGSGLRGVAERYEKHHQVRISEPAITASVILAKRYISDRALPDTAVDLLDEKSRKRIDYSKIDELFAAGLPGIPPLESDGKHATYNDWIEAWQSFKAGM